MKKVLGAVLAFSIAAVAQSPQKPSPQERFVLVPAEVKAGIGLAEDQLTHEVFLLDTQTGAVWRFQPGGPVTKPDGRRVYEPDLFIPVKLGPALHKDQPIVEDPPMQN